VDGAYVFSIEISWDDQLIYTEKTLRDGQLGINVEL
jgi:hypothetical protein